MVTRFVGTKKVRQYMERRTQDARIKTLERDILKAQEDKKRGKVKSSAYVERMIGL